MINENNNALEIEIFLFFFWPFQPFPAMVILTVHAQCDWCMIAKIFVYVYWVIFPEWSTLAMIETSAYSELNLLLSQIYKFVEKYKRWVSFYFIICVFSFTQLNH